MRSPLRAIALPAVACVILNACTDGGSFGSGGDGPCSVSYGFQDYRDSGTFEAAIAELEQHMGAPMPAPPPPDWATDFSVAKGTLLVLAEDDSGNKRNTESPYRYGWIRYGVEGEERPDVTIGVREIPYCSIPDSAIDERTIHTSGGNRRVGVMEGEDGVKVAHATVFIEGRKPWTTINFEWPIETPADEREDVIKSWVAAVVEAEK